MTSGGTESIFMAVKTARDKARAERGIKKGKLVIPRTSHPAFIKAAHLLDIDWVHVPLREDLRTYAEDMEPLLDDDTVLAVGGAPNYPFGMIDPIPEMAAMAAAKNIPFHVDACLGGFMLPWVERLGIDVPPWDFRVPGVTSISADLHKYGFVIKGASVVMHRPKANLRYQVFQFADWPGGIYGDAGVPGHQARAADRRRLGRPASARRRGLREARPQDDGRHEEAHRRRKRDARRARLGRTEHVRRRDRLARPRHPRRRRHAERKGWHFDRQEGPPSIHLMASPTHLDVVDEFLADLRYALDHHAEKCTKAATYGDDVSKLA